MPCELCPTLATMFPFSIIRIEGHDGVPLQQGPLRENEKFLSVIHGPFKIVKGRRCIQGGPDDVFVETSSLSAVGQMSNWKHLLRMIQVVNTDGSCCVCLSERSNLVGCPQCTATMCHSCFARMGAYNKETGWTSSCPQCRHSVTALKEDTPPSFIPWFYRCNGTSKSRVTRALVARLTLRSLKTGIKLTGTFVFKLADGLPGAFAESMPFEHIPQPVKDGWYKVRCITGSDSWEEVVPNDVHRLYGWRK